MPIRHLTIHLLSDRLDESRDFYADLLDLRIADDGDGFVRLVAPSDPTIAFSILQRDHDRVPAAWQAAAGGDHLNFIVDQVDAVHARAVARGLPIVQPPRNEFHGQRRLLVSDPDGRLVDISSPWRRATVPDSPRSERFAGHQPDGAAGEHEIVDGLVGGH